MSKKLEIYLHKTFDGCEIESNISNAIIELKHIKLELKNDRLNHMRHFIDQYYCYKKNYVSQNGSAKWKFIYEEAPKSEEAEKCRNDNDSLDCARVVKEHVVPLKRISEIIRNRFDVNNKHLSLEEIAELLDKYLNFAIITKNEDQLLRNNKLSSEMPSGWNENDCIWARYCETGINIVDMPNCLQSKCHFNNLGILNESKET